MSGDIRILVIDDDRDLVEALRLVLSAEGFTVHAAYDPVSGLAAVEAHHPDLILLDIMMPEATEGFHFVWKLRQNADDYSRTVPIIVLSAIHGTTDLRFYPDSADGTYRAGEYLSVQDFVDKPVDPSRLVERIRRALRVASVR